jgi:hypothetical protein
MNAFSATCENIFCLLNETSKIKNKERDGTRERKSQQKKVEFGRLIYGFMIAIAGFLSLMKLHS